MIADSTDIRFECTKCGQHLVVESAAAGLTADCPICNTTVTVPNATAPAAAKIAEEAPRSRSGLANAPTYSDPGPDELREELIDASMISGKLLGDLNHAREEIARLQQQLRSVAEENEHLNASATHAQAELKTFQGERPQFKAEITTLRQRLAATEEVLGEREGEIAGLRAEAESSVPSSALAELQDKVNAIEIDLAAASQSRLEWKTLAEDTDADLGAARGELAQRTGELAEAREALVQAQTAAARAAGQIHSLEQALAAEHTTREQLAVELAERRRQTAEFQARIEQRKGDLTEARNRVKELETALATTTDRAARLENESVELVRRLDAAGAELSSTGGLRENLDRTAAELAERTEALRLAQDSADTLAARCDGLRRENDTLRRDLAESNTGRELIAVRDRLEAATADRDRAAERVAALEADIHAFAGAEAALREELDATCRDRDEAFERLSEIAESRFVQDNEVLRGIVARLNAEIAQRTGEVFKLKRARYALKLAYVVFGIGLLAVCIFALIVLPHALRN